MKQFIKKSFILISFAMLLILLMPAAAEAKAKLNKKSITLDVGKSTKLKLTGTKKKVTWSSSNKKIATVSSSGKVKARSEGTATIRAKAGKKTYKCKVTVLDNWSNNYKAIAKAYKTGNSSRLSYTDKKVLSKVKKILSQNIRSGMPDEEKALVLHDWICKNATYESYTKGRVSGQVNYVDVLFKGKACCAGYSGVYQLFMQCLGIENQVAISQTHGWNVVKIDGKWYNVDITYDYNHGNGILHTYFLKSDQWLPQGTSHIATNKKKKCNNEDFETYPYTGKYPVINTTEEHMAYLEKIKSKMKVGERRTAIYLKNSSVQWGLSSKVCKLI
ncbi:MAG: Ig-like domain-containing protein [Roseburia sp.]|nr:Ig-like domain-containing protein [Roseburia sp.]MCM1277959.1 Ig-like domain-containing protein [Robinsoniella sp.]